MVKRFSLRSGAKINIGLRVVSKRNDGYHNIETIFYPVNIFDNIFTTIEKITGGRDAKNIIIIKTEPSLDIPGDSNICTKAVNMFFDEFGTEGTYRIKINIEKNIPVGAGLGGGSSNGAIILKILFKHFLGEARFVEQSILKLRKIALKLGSDVPFFLQNKPSYATSRGEVLAPLRMFNIEQGILIVNPGIHISTAWAFKQLNIASNNREGLYHMRGIRKFDTAEKDKYINDFEDPVFKKHPEIKKIKSDMYKMGSSISLMTGSGSTVFGLFNKKADMISAQNYFKNKNYLTFTS